MSSPPLIFSPSFVFNASVQAPPHTSLGLTSSWARHRVPVAAGNPRNFVNYVFGCRTHEAAFPRMSPPPPSTIRPCMMDEYTPRRRRRSSIPTTKPSSRPLQPSTVPCRHTKPPPVVVSVPPEVPHTQTEDIYLPELTDAGTPLTPLTPPRPPAAPPVRHGMRGSMVIRLRPCMIMSTTPSPGLHLEKDALL